MSESDTASGCFGKQAFPTPQAARTQMRHISGGPYAVYKCQQCGSWHYGSTEKMDRQPKRWKNWHWRKSTGGR